jgi:STE24 endopeptidase
MRRFGTLGLGLAGLLLLAGPAFAFDPEAATRAYLDSLPATARQASNAYFEGGYWFILWNFLAGSAVTLLFLVMRLGAGLRRWAESWGAPRGLQTLLVAIILFAMSSVIVSPLSYQEGFVREHAFHLSTQTFSAWLTEWLEREVIGTVIAALILTMIYFVIRRAPRNWWVIGALVIGVFTGALNVAGPVLLEPIFNKFTPMAASPSKDAILSMARANGVPADNVYIFDTSRQSTRVTAHVSGLFGTTRISLGDNLLGDGSPAEVKAVMGHELGHYVLNHAWFLIAWQTLGAVLALGLIAWIYGGMARGGAFGIRDPGDPAGLPLFLLIAGVLSFVATPLTNTLTRTIETQADYFGLNTAQEPDGFAKVTLKLSIYRKLEPTPLEEFVFFDHPSGYNRIHRAMLWKAEHLGSAVGVLSQEAPGAVAPDANPAPSPPPTGKP